MDGYSERNISASFCRKWRWWTLDCLCTGEVFLGVHCWRDISMEGHVELSEKAMRWQRDCWENQCRHNAGCLLATSSAPAILGYFKSKPEPQNWRMITLQALLCMWWLTWGMHISLFFSFPGKLFGVMQMEGVLIWIKAKWTEWNYPLFYIFFLTFALTALITLSNYIISLPPFYT